MTANEMSLAFKTGFDGLYEFTAPEYNDELISNLLTKAQFRVFLSRYNPDEDKGKKGFEGTEQRRKDLQKLVNSITILREAKDNYLYGTAGNNYATLVYEDSDSEESILATEQFAIGDRIFLGINKVGGDGYATILALKSDDIYIDKTLLLDIQYDFDTHTGELSILPIAKKSPKQNDAHDNGMIFEMPSNFLYAIEEFVKLETDEEEPEVLSKISIVKPIVHDYYTINIYNPYKKPYKDVLWRLDVGDTSVIQGKADSVKRVEICYPEGYNIHSYKIRYLQMPPNIVCNTIDDSLQYNCILDESVHMAIVDEAVAIAQAASKKEDYQLGRVETTLSE